MRYSGWLMAVLLSCVPFIAHAEVRIEQLPEGPYLVVQPAARGVWSPGPRSDARELLNPAGDVLGDGFPSHVRGGGKLMAAWPSRGSIALAEVHESGVSSMTIAGARPSGSIVLVQAPWGWVVLWQEGGNEPGVFASIIRNGAAGAAIPLEGDVLLHAFALQDEVLIATGDTERDLVIVSRTPMTPIPVPIGYVPLELTPPPAFCLSTELGSAATIVISRARGEAVAFSIDELGMTSAVSFHAPVGSCTAVLKAAER